MTIIALALCGLVDTAEAATFQIIHHFSGSDGITPHDLIIGKDGNLYGDTMVGGEYDAGVVFKMTPDGTETVLHSFTYNNWGIGLVFGNDGNLYGSSSDPYTLFRLKLDGTYQVIHQFDGERMSGQLAVDGTGNLVGETLYVHRHPTGPCLNGCGSIFRIAPDGTGYKRLYTFTGRADGAYPVGGLIADGKGNVYGTAVGLSYDGNVRRNWGTIFKLSANRVLTNLYTFTKFRRGTYIAAGVTMDADGSLYAVAGEGGSLLCQNWQYGGALYGCGKVFRLTPDGTLDVLHRFRGGDDGALPFQQRPILDADHNLYGTTSAYPGSVYEISRTGHKRTLHVGDAEGIPGALVEKDGVLYGTVKPGGSAHYGAIFKLDLRH